MWKCHNLTQVGQRLRIRHVQGLRSGCYRLFYRVLRLFQCVYKANLATPIQLACSLYGDRFERLISVKSHVEDKEFVMYNVLN